MYDQVFKVISFLHVLRPQNSACTFNFPQTCHMPRPFHPTGFDRPNISQRVQIMKGLI